MFEKIISMFYHRSLVINNFSQYYFLLSLQFSAIAHIIERDMTIFQEKDAKSSNLDEEIARLKEILEVKNKKIQDLEDAYEREEKAKNDLFDELGNLEDNSNQIKDLLQSAKEEIQDYQGIRNSYVVKNGYLYEFI